MTTFNLSMELWQSPFYPKDRQRDLLPLMEFKDFSVSDGDVMGSKRQRRGYRGRKGANAAAAAALRALVPLFKGFGLHHSSASRSGPTFNRLTSRGGGGGGGNAAKPSEAPRRREVGVGGWGTSSVRPDSYLWEMTVCKYLNLHRGTRGDDEERREIGGVSSRHLFHQASSKEVQLPDSVRVIGECAITPADTPCMNTFLAPLPTSPTPPLQCNHQKDKVTAAELKS